MAKSLLFGSRKTPFWRKNPFGISDAPIHSYEFAISVRDQMFDNAELILDKDGTQALLDAALVSLEKTKLEYATVQKTLVRSEQTDLLYQLTISNWEAAVSAWKYNLHVVKNFSVIEKYRDLVDKGELVNEVNENW